MRILFRCIEHLNGKGNFGKNAKVFIPHIWQIMPQTVMIFACCQLVYILIKHSLTQSTMPLRKVFVVHFAQEKKHYLH